MRLFRGISLSAATFLVIGNIVGVGIFTTPGLIAEKVGSSAWILGVWVLGGFLALIGAACYALLARHIPKAGGEYAFLYPSYGPFVAFLSGWASLLIGFSAPVAGAALGMASYLRYFIPALTDNPLGVKFVAIATLLAVSLFISLGLRFGAQFHSGITFLNVGLIASFSLALLWYGDPQNNLSPVLAHGLTEVDFSSLASAVIMVMFGYSGWNATVYVSEEVRDPKRNIPTSLFLGTAAVIAAYLLINVAFFSAVPLEQLAGQIPVGEIAASHTLGAVGAGLVNLLIISSIVSSLTAMSIAGPRVYFAMSRDHLFPAWLSQVDGIRNLPLKAIWFQTGIAVLLVSITELRDILILSGTILLLFTTLTSSALFLIKWEEGNRLTFFLLYRLLPAIFVGLNLAILVNAAASSDWPEMRASLLVILAGIPVYLYYRRRRSRSLPSLPEEPAG